MTPVAAPRDPRSIVTPDAFSISKELLGIKLAPPGKRLLALFVDLIVISILTAVTRSFASILGIVVAVLFIRQGFKRTPVRGTAVSRAMRGSVGCLGVVIGIVTSIVWISTLGGGSNDDDEGPSVVGLEFPTTPGGVFESVASAVVVAAFREARTLAQAEDATRDFVEASQELGIAPEDLRAVLTAAVPDDAVWADDAPAMFDRLLPGPPSEPPELESRDVIAIRDEVSLYTPEEALEAYQALLASGRTEDLDLARREALEARLTDVIAADTLRALTARIADLDDDLQEAEEDLRETASELEAVESRGIFSTFRSFLDELGFGFGWASLYFTVMLSWWKGQTIGKRLFRIRVLRLDGGSINWWVAFERAGGYAAGLATGLLGFAQIFWDANRQAIHDRIVGTVVALDPPERVLDWESVL
jgi:hypothetical protein